MDDSYNYTSNSTFLRIESLCEINSTELSYGYAALLFLIAVLSTTGNGIVLAAIIRFKALRTPSLMLIGALAFVDFLTGSVVTPLFAILSINPELPWHKANRILMVVVVLLSLITIVYISIDRFLHVYYLQSYQITRRKLLSGLLLLWITPFIFHSIVRAIVNRTHGRAAGKIAGRKSAIAVILLCIIAMIFSYSGIIFMLKKHAKQVSDSIRQKYIENQTRAAKTAFLIVAVVIAMNSFAIAYSAMKDTSTFHCAITLVSLLGNSVVNPLVYCVRIPLMKKHIAMMFCGEVGEDTDDEFRERMLTRTSSVQTSLNVNHNVSLKGVMMKGVKGVSV